MTDPANSPVEGSEGAVGTDPSSRPVSGVSGATPGPIRGPGPGRSMCTCSGSEFPGSCHCTGCCRSFSSESAFRAHLVVERGRVVEHLDPAEVGLYKRSNGTWSKPGPGWSRFGKQVKR